MPFPGVVKSHPVLSVVLVLAAIANLVLNVSIVRVVDKYALSRRPPPSHYSYAEMDNPPYIPLPPSTRDYRLVIEESERLTFTNPESVTEWLWAATPAVGDNNVHLGENNKIFEIASLHQLHCMRWIQVALYAGATGDQSWRDDARKDAGHITHCINTLRNSILCAADITLEPGDALTRNYTESRVGGEHRCKNWKAVNEFSTATWMKWRQWQIDNLETVGESHLDA